MVGACAPVSLPRTRTPPVAGLPGRAGRGGALAAGRSRPPASPGEPASGAQAFLKPSKSLPELRPLSAGSGERRSDRFNLSLPGGSRHLAADAAPCPPAGSGTGCRGTPPPPPPALPKLSREAASPPQRSDGVKAIAVSDGRLGRGEKSSLQKPFGRCDSEKVASFSKLSATPRSLLFTAATPLGKSLPLFAIREITRFFSAAGLSLAEQN